MWAVVYAVFCNGGFKHCFRSLAAKHILVHFELKSNKFHGIKHKNENPLFAEKTVTAKR